jgi:hypothetical protein
MENMMNYGYTCEIFPINPKAKEILVDDIKEFIISAQEIG